jgi:choline dehydrogenase-like flavoprotein
VVATDYVIVGAGSAGCVLANRLTEDPSTTVKLIEAGGRDRHPNISIPAAFANQFHTKLDWDYCTEPEPHVDGRSLYIPRGKALGGSSSMNAMLYVRGRPLDYDLWAKQGATGWGWDEVLPYFLRSEDNARGASEFHGVGGELRVDLDRGQGVPRAGRLAEQRAGGVEVPPAFERLKGESRRSLHDLDAEAGGRGPYHARAADEREPLDPVADDVGLDREHALSYAKAAGLEDQLLRQQFRAGDLNPVEAEERRPREHPASDRQNEQRRD